MKKIASEKPNRSEKVQKKDQKFLCGKKEKRETGNRRLWFLRRRKI